jgi:hypothetical protein
MNAHEKTSSFQMKLLPALWPENRSAGNVYCSLDSISGTLQNSAPSMIEQKLPAVEQGPEEILGGLGAVAGFAQVAAGAGEFAGLG